ncbi:MAG: 3-phosphoshikimate 1-carboxyvinyltransferase [Ignavibacteria bacterium]|nr:3-phosphoshikimate 1-carboxyvinyltransferase [Ignavibacteria bacterium]
MFVFTPPPSKSHTNRALILAALTDGISIIKNHAVCEDTIYMIRALKKLGVKFEEKENELIVHGTGAKFNKKKVTLFCGNAGTTFRFLTALSIFNDGEVILTGSKRMLERPIGDLVDALKQLDVKVESNNGYPPVKIYGGSFKSTQIKINAKKSSQFLSALLLIMPVLGKDFIINLEGVLPSLPYVKMTIQTLKDFGTKIYHENFQRFYLKENLKLKSAKIIIESDASSATYFLGSAAVLRKSIKVNGLNKKSTQADIKFIHVLQKMGCKVEWGKNFVRLSGKKLKGISVDMNDAPDSVPALAVVSLFAEGKTLIRNIENLRYKESDRIQALANELSKLGAIVRTGDDFLEINPIKNYKPAVIKTYNDHRIAMSFAIAQLKIPEIQIKNPECVKKSFPNFWKEFNKMRVSYKL